MDCSQEVASLLARVSDLPIELRQHIQALSQATTPNEAFLDGLSSAALTYNLTTIIFTTFSKLALELCARWNSQQCIQSVAAYGRMIHLLPYLAEVAHLHLFGRDILQDITELELRDRQELLLGVFRLLQQSRRTLSRSINLGQLTSLLQDEDHTIRYLTVRVICTHIHASDAVLEDMIEKYLGHDAIIGSWEGKEIDYRFLSFWEEKRISDMKDLYERAHAHTHATEVTRIIDQKDLSRHTLLVSDTLLLRHKTVSSPTSDEVGIVQTATTSANLHSFAEALLQPEPILITGLAGSGKTTLVRHMAKSLDKSDSMVTLHLNEQSDAKLLIGIYTTGSQPGSFEWQPGVLTTAVKEGRWVFIEDLDRAPNEVMSALLPLIERKELIIPSRGEKLRAAEGFRIIATMRTSINLQGEEVVPNARMLGSRLWQRATFAVPKIDELADIINANYPALASLMPRIMATYTRLQHELNRGKAARMSSTRTRTVSARELLKWSDRINEVLRIENQRTTSNTISETAIDGMFLDAVDCFAGSLEDGVDRDFLVSCIAEEWHISPQRKMHLLYERTVPVKRSKGDHKARATIGRAALHEAHTRQSVAVIAGRSVSTPYAMTPHSSRLLEQVAVAVERSEPLLLVGETGIGKTTAVQHLSQMLGHKLLAINLSQQSETGDLLGGFKPVTTRSLVIPLQDEFTGLFEESFSQKKNQRFVEMLSKSIARGQWKRTIALWKEALKMVDKAYTAVKAAISEKEQDVADEQRVKRRKVASNKPDRALWDSFITKVESLEHRFAGSAEVFTFSFTEGKLVKAVREGDWVLLDEINLATPDTLECLSDLLDSGPNAKPSIMLTETGQVERIEAHPNFRIFAAMNPATDVGKKDLPMGIRSRFTEIYVNSPDRDIQSLQILIKTYLERSGGQLSGSDRKLPITVTELYQEIQRLVAEEGLVDGSAQRPHYSLRTLTRALTHASTTAPQCGLRRALYEGFSMCFFTALDTTSEAKLQQLVKEKLFTSPASAKAELAKPLRAPEDGSEYVETVLKIETLEKGKKVQEERHWMAKGPNSPEDVSQYIITPYIARNLRNVIRAASTRKHPILIQGPTSAGKTSMIEYLARRSGNVFVRINNHEHTDLQEYLGSYVSTSDGQLVFQEGVLVQAVRAGHWVVLDELNLAPTDVLEALNRLLDDNRELLIPETQEIVRPHPNFMLFATQNPAGPYGGRKMLSRAFRNRFLELHFDDIPVQELNVILARRSNLPESWCSLVVDVYKRLSTLRQEQRLFEQNSFATLRDLFRWAFRSANSVEELADNGYMLLAEKVRKSEERDMVRQTIEKVMSRKGVKIVIDDDKLYNSSRCSEIALYDQLTTGGIVWTKAMRRLYVLVATAIRHNEAVLLVGETGCGKTTVCQMLAAAMKQQLHIVNAHQNTETGDLIGAQRPIRNRAAIMEALLSDLASAFSILGVTTAIEIDIEGLLGQYDVAIKEHPDKVPSDISQRVAVNRAKRKALFEWSDGSLIQAMREGTFYLLDEISLADDSVLERMNSILDPQRSILLAEKGTTDSLVIAQPGFQFFATMNPGGDFGKKELSPALRNRFTEIWVPPLSDVGDVLEIVHGKIINSASSMAPVIVEFAKWFNDRFANLKASTISIRDILAFVHFLNTQGTDLIRAVVHAAALVYIDTLGANPAALLATTGKNIERERMLCLVKLSELLGQDVAPIYHEDLAFANTDTTIGIGSFKIVRRGPAADDMGFNFQAPTTKINTMRVARALQVNKPILLEGNPGVGKTSIITAIAKAVGVPLTRINLSEQTDLMDLFGSDMPVEGAEAGYFAWRDAPFLTAMKRGEWVLLDEMNLASQSVLEGLNACLDHRGEVYIAELDQSFARHPDFRLFAAQNPHHQGGGRKGLPASFVNRFTVVYADVFKQDDLEMIYGQLFPDADANLVTGLVSFISKLDTAVTTEQRFGARGSPWEFNLRDTLRWLQLCTSRGSLLPAGSAQDYLDTLFTQRFRSDADKQAVRRLFADYFGNNLERRDCHVNLSRSSLQIGVGLVSREAYLQSTEALPLINTKARLDLLETLLICVQQQWPVMLVGASNSGKTYLLKSLSSLLGKDLEVFPMNADVDAMDLVGGFEQVDVTRRVQAFVQNLLRYVRSALARHLTDLHSAADAIPSLIELSTYASQVSVQNLDLSAVKTYLDHIPTTIKSSDLQELVAECDLLIGLPTNVASAKFEWIDGILVKALEQGRWLVLDNANLCSSSVLDRLNSLLEPNGTLIINEHPAEDGSARIIRPHPDFRIFMTIDPQYGEVSRAMRNRAVEIFVPSLPETSSSVSSHVTALRLESSMQRYHTLADVCNTLVDPHTTRPEGIVDCAVDMLSMDDMSLLQRFHEQAKIGLVDDGALDALGKVFMQALEAAQLQPGWELTPASYYDNIHVHLQNATDFRKSQSIHPLVNQPLVAYNARITTHHDPLSLAYKYETLLEVTRMHIALVQTRSDAQESRTMSRLQRSFASARIPNAKKDSTVWVASFLTNVTSAILDWVKSDDNTHATNETIMSNLSYFNTFWWNMFDLVSSTTFNEAIFQVYLSIGQRMLSDSTPNTTEIQLFNHINKQFEGFHAQTKMLTGLSMETIWNICHPPIVPTLRQLEEIWQLERIADQFDELVWKMKAPLADLHTLRRSITKAFELARQQEVDIQALTKDLESALLLQSAVEPHAEEEQGPFFRRVFEGICQYADLASATNLAPEAALLAKRSSKNSVSYSGWSPAAVALDKLSTFSGPEADTLAIGGGLSSVMMHKITISTEVKLKNHSLLSSEFEVLGQSVATNTTTLSENQLDNTWTALRSFAIGLLSAHEDITSVSDVRGALTINWKPTESPARQICEQYLQPAIGWDADESNVHNQFEASAIAFIRLAVGLILLYVPDRPFDPSLPARIQKQLYDSRLTSLQKRFTALSKLAELTAGQPSSLRSRMVEAEIAALGDAPTVTAVARPGQSQLELLQADFSNLLNLVDRIARDINENTQIGERSSDYIRGVLAVISRLTGNYKAYEDIVKPAVGFVNILKIGLVLLEKSQHHATSEAQRKVQIVLTHTPFMQEDPAVYASRAPDLELRRDTDLILHDLQLLRLRSGLTQPAKWTLEAQSELITFFSMLYSVWEVQLNKEQKAAAAASNLYEYKGSFEDEEEATEAELNSMFPSYEDELDEENAPVKKETNLNLQSITPTLADLHMGIFQKQDDKTPDVATLLKSATQIIGKASSNDSELGRASVQDYLPAIMLKIHEQKINIREETTVSQNYNIYTDVNISEARKVVALVEATQSAIHPILEAWPEHATLHNILHICDELLAFRHIEPVMKFLTKTEKLHAQLVEWQTVASKEYSAASVLNRTTDLLISWRQLELSTWARMLDLESEKARSDARSWYFLAYENVVHKPLTLDMSTEQMSEHATELVASLESFMSASTLGQFATKLKILASLQAHLTIAANEKPSLLVLCSGLANFIHHLERFEPAVKKTIDDGRKKLEKDIQNTIKLASWRDRNIQALRQSAAKSHNKLFKVIRKYRAILNQPAGTILVQEVSKPLPTIALAGIVAGCSLSTAWPSAVAFLQQIESVWKARPDRFKDITSTVTLMERKSTIDNAFDTGAHLVSFIEELEVSIDQLAKATPAVLTEENASVVKHLTTRKRKLFADTLKDLRTMGLKSNISIDVLMTQSSTAKILSSMPVLAPAACATAQDLFSRLLDVLPKVRSSHTEHNEDLTQAEVTRSIGYLESLLQIVLKQRSSIAHAFDGHKALETQIAQINNIWSSEGRATFLANNSDTTQLSNAQTYLPWLPVIVRGGIAVLEAQASLGKLDFSGLVTTLQAWATCFEDLLATIAALPSTPIALHTSSHLALVERVQSATQTFTQVLEEYSNSTPLAKVTLDHITKWVLASAAETGTIDHDTTSQSTEASTSSFAISSDMAITEHYNLLNQVLGSIQDVANALQQLPTSAEDAGWLLREERAQHLLLTSFHMETITKSLQSILDSTSSTAQVGTSSLSAVCASLTMALPILQRHHASFETCLYNYLNIHTATCNLTYRLSRSFMRISSQGFCKPAEASEEKSGATEKLESGTGLGEGEGAEDISKDIEGDEDLDDLAQDPNNKREGDAMQNEDDAVSIQDELEGGAGESKGKEEQEDGDGKDEKDEKDEGEEGSVGDGGEDGGQEDVDDEGGLDEDMGDVDDLGPSAVDEKMWDQAGEEGQKEQESKNNQGQVDENDQAAGKDEKQKKEVKKGEEGEAGDEKEEGGEDEDDEMSDLQSEIGGPEDQIAADPHVKDDEGLELPEELKLDGDKGEHQDEEDGFDQAMPDVEGEGEEDAEDRPDELDETDAPKAEDQEEPTETDQQADELDRQQDQSEDQAQDEDLKQLETQGDGEAGDEDMADLDDQAGGGLANQNNPVNQQDQQGTDADARDNAQEDEQSADQPPSTSAAKRQTGQEKSGATDQAQAASSDPTNREQEAPQPDKTSADQQTIRKLGDILEKWHRQQKQIRDTTSERQEEQAPQDVDVTDADFEHLPNEEAQADTQALGASSKEQARALDESMAVETEERLQDQDIENRLQNADEEDEPVDDDVDMDIDTSAQDNSAAAGIDTQAESRTFVGERRDPNEPIPSPPSPPTSTHHPSSDNDDDLDLTALALTTRGPTPSNATITDPSALWHHHTTRTHPLTLTLTSHLRLILAPTLATKLRGDFRTGKRLNIKRIIPYIASSYKRDKIWMRRSVPSKRAYQVLLAIDDSKSMAENGSAAMAFDTLAMVSKALTAVEVGEVGVVAFGEEVRVLHELGTVLGDDAGAAVIGGFGFRQERTNVRRLMERSIELFRDARGRASGGGGGGADLWQLEVVVSDGICEDHEGIRRLLLRAMEERIMIVFVIVDAASGASVASKASGTSQASGKSTAGTTTTGSAAATQSSSSIVDLEKVEFIQMPGQDGEAGEMKLVRTKYLDTFPFGYYLVVKDVRDLPGVLSTALRQWFAEVAER